MAATKKVLIVEDDRSLAGILAYNLEQNGYQVSHAFDGREALEQARLIKPDIVLLDVMLPGFDGVQICKQLRRQKETQHTQIIMLTAKSTEMDQISGFEAGADDYVVKPYSVRVLLERMRALQRRPTTGASSGGPIKQESLSSQGITLDLKRHRAFVHDVELELTRSEFKLLETLLAEPGRAFDRNELIESALGEDTMVLERTIDVHIRAIRRKLGDEAAKVIETVRGVGYRFKEDGNG